MKILIFKLSFLFITSTAYAFEDCDLQQLGQTLAKATQEYCPECGLDKKTAETQTANKELELKTSAKNFQALYPKQSQCDSIRALIELRKTESFYYRYKLALENIKNNELTQKVNELESKCAGARHSPPKAPAPPHVKEPTNIAH